MEKYKMIYCYAVKFKFLFWHYDIIIYYLTKDPHNNCTFLYLLNEYAYGCISTYICHNLAKNKSIIIYL